MFVDLKLPLFPKNIESMGLVYLPTFGFSDPMGNRLLFIFFGDPVAILPSVNYHFSPLFGRICLELFPSIEHANLSE